VSNHPDNHSAYPFCGAIPCTVTTRRPGEMQSCLDPTADRRVAGMQYKASWRALTRESEARTHLT